MEQFFCNYRNRLTAPVHYMIIPAHEIAGHIPAIEVDIITRSEQRDFSSEHTCVLPVDVELKFRKKRQHLFLNSSDMISVLVKYMKAVSPRQLPLHGKSGIPILVIDIKAVKPGKILCLILNFIRYLISNTKKRGAQSLCSKRHTRLSLI